ncbi:MAG: FAD-dependent oxidoreductase [Bacteroidales bacterium]|nr:FAD-dependent oxidoreductase [Bacteroidales bacterium]MBN2632501.1 FAD-dependent oxidoreductase [Bacteroidales bacterium]
MDTGNHYDTIVIGGGPAGLTAGIYLSRARVKTLILNEGAAGGQMVLTHEIANYPGVETISGYQLSAIMKKQALSFGCKIRSNISIAATELYGDIKKITLSDGSYYTSDTVVIASGGRPRMLGIPGEDELRGKGISYCATCDGDFFTGKEIIVVGGGNSALEEAVSLTKYARKVTVVHQFDHFQAFEYAVREAEDNPAINFLMETVVASFDGQEKLESVLLKNLRTDELTRLRTDGAFIFIGYVPNTEFLRGVIEMNSSGEIIVDDHMATSIKGVFAAGDSIVKRYRQVTTAVGDGTIAALAATAYINEMKMQRKETAVI